MYRCNECGTRIHLIKPQEGDIIECDICGVELELIENTLLSRQLGLSEE